MSENARKLFLKSGEICAIIKACSENGVTELKFGDLQVSFKLKKPEPIEPELTTEIPATEIAEAIQQSSADALEKEELQTRDDELEHMLVENPRRYEELMAQGDLESKATGKVDGASELQ